MKCQSCDSNETKVIDSRQSQKGLNRRRRLECLKCGHRFSTYELQSERPVLPDEVFNRASAIYGEAKQLMELLGRFIQHAGR